MILSTNNTTHLFHIHLTPPFSRNKKRRRSDRQRIVKHRTTRGQTIPGKRTIKQKRTIFDRTAKQTDTPIARTTARRRTDTSFDRTAEQTDIPIARTTVRRQTDTGEQRTRQSAAKRTERSTSTVKRTTPPLPHLLDGMSLCKFSKFTNWYTG